MTIPLRGLQQRFGREGVYTQQIHAHNQGWSIAHSLFSVNTEIIKHGMMTTCVCGWGEKDIPNLIKLVFLTPMVFRKFLGSSGSSKG